MPQRVALIVEDNESDRELLQQILEDHDFRVFVQPHGAGAIEMLKSWPVMPDLLLVDMAMPEMSGALLFNTIKTVPEWAAIPFIFITGRDKTDDMYESQRADDFIRKPYDPDNLIERVNKVLERYNK